MVNSSDGMLRKVAWAEVFPWLILARCVRIAIQPRLLIAAAIGILLTVVSWAIIQGVCIAPVDDSYACASGCPWKTLTSIIPDSPHSAAVPGQAVGSVLDYDPIIGVWKYLTKPFQDVFGLETGFAGMISALLSGAAAIAIWGYFGGIITRSASLQLATGDRDHVGLTLRFACKHWRNYVVAPITPLMGVAAIAIPLWIMGLLLRAYLGVLVALAWPLLLCGGFLIALLLAGLAFGWPLMWGNVSTEGVDSFDAISRSYDYVFHRPLNYAFYVAVAAAIGAATWTIVYYFTAGIVGATYWAVGWGCGTEELAGVMAGQGITGGLIHFWCQCLKLLAVGFLFSYFWTASSAIYLLLRRDNDATELDEIRAEDEGEQECVPLPPLKTEGPIAPNGDPETGSESPS
jgi:hypothetical protein